MKIKLDIIYSDMCVHGLLRIYINTHDKVYLSNSVNLTKFIYVYDI